MTTAIFVGRNVAGTRDPMPAYDWAEFRALIGYLVKLSGGTLVFEGTGEGVDTTTGEREESWVCVYFGGDERALRRAVQAAAYQYDQAEVAILTGETVFLKAGLTG